MDPDLIKLLGTGTISAGLLFLIYLVGNRLVAAIDRIAAKVDEHTKLDLEHHADVKESVVRLESKMDTVLGMTPARGIAIVRPSTQGDR